MRVQDAWDLRVLVNPYKGIGHIVVPEVHGRRAHPSAAHLRLHPREHTMHEAADVRRRLHAVQPLPRVAQPVAIAVE
jgi:hypothetical protein